MSFRNLEGLPLSYLNVVIRARAVRTAFSLALLLFVCACTATVSPVSGNLPGQERQASETDRPSGNAMKNLSAAELVRIGHNYLDKGNLQLARLHFSVAAGKDSASPAPHSGLGESLLLDGEIRQAAEAFDKALQNDENYVPSLLGKARILRHQKDLEGARDLLSQAIDLAPSDAQVLTEMARTQDDLGKIEEAEVLFLKVAELHPERSASHNNLGVVYLVQGRYGDATRAFSRATGIEPDNKQTQNNLATAYALAGDETRALKVFEKTVGKPAAYNNIGYIHMTRGEWDRAERAFKRALELNPTFYTRAQENLERLAQLRAESAL